MKNYKIEIKGKKKYFRRFESCDTIRDTWHRSRGVSRQKRRRLVTTAAEAAATVT